MEENQLRTIYDLRDGRPCVVKMTIKDKMKDLSFTSTSKSLAKFDVLKQQSSFFYRNEIGALRQHTEFSRRFYSVANSAGQVDRNWEL